MHITPVQDTIFWSDISANLAKIHIHLRSLAGKTDLVILPEMFSTGFCTNRTDLAETNEGTTVSSLKTWAREYGLAITGSFIAKEDEKIYNRAFFIFPTGELHYANKRHLFSMGNEKELFKAGGKRLLVNYKGFNICVLICYDLRFPVWSRNKNNEYDLLIYVANWPTVRIDAWNTLLAARAIENQSYVCGVNITGTDGNNLSYNGNTKLFDAKGKILYSAKENESSIETLEIDLNELHNFREKFPVWKDADEFTVLQSLQ